MTDWTIVKLLDWTKDYFQKHNIPNPRLDAELLLAHTLTLKKRIDLYLQHDRILKEDELLRFKSCIKRRAEREPLQYITGQQEFYGIPIKVTPVVLIPRPETELLVEAVLKRVDKDATLSILDIGTGSGAILAALASELPNARLFGTDISEEALKIAGSNVAAWQDRITLLKSNLFESLDSGSSFDVIVSNPPYIRPSERTSLEPEVERFEPADALFTRDEDGLDFFRRIINDAPRYISNNGTLAMEMGNGQAEHIANMLGAIGNFTDIKVIKDCNGVERIIVARRHYG